MATQNKDVTVPMGRCRAAERTKNPVRQWFDALAAWALFSLGMFSGPLQAGWLDDVKASLPGGWGAPPYRVVDAGYWLQTGDPHRMVNWIDQDRVIFVGGPLTELGRVQREGYGRYPVHLFVWDTSKNRVEVHSKIESVHGLCYRGGYIRYFLPVNTDEHLILKSGPFGQETETIVDRKHDTVEARKNRGMLYSELRCKEYPYADILIGEKRGLFPLLEGHGYLDIYADPFIPDRKMEPVRWYRDRTSPPVDLPIIKLETGESLVSYIEWSSNYVIETRRARDQVHNSTGDWPKNVPRPVYLMKLDGSIKQINLPYINGITSNGGDFFQLRAGLAFLSRSVVPNRPGKAGVYIWTGGDAVHRALPGEPAAAALSPDGCKLAVAIDPRDHGGPNRYYLKMIDFCSKGGK